MVKLSFTAYVPAPLPQVWAFFSKFENVAQWDPSIPAIKIKKQNPNKIGTLYEVKTVFRGN
jgi:ligand-binding SRPBCC domain-containing protein